MKVRKYTFYQTRQRAERLVKFAKRHPHWTQEELAKRYGLTQARVSQILVRARRNGNGAKPEEKA